MAWYVNSLAVAPLGFSIHIVLLYIIVDVLRLGWSALQQLGDLKSTIAVGLTKVPLVFTDCTATKARAGDA